MQETDTTMSRRDGLIGLIRKSHCVETWDYYNDEQMSPCPIEQLADCLLAGGVLVPPCKVGDTVYKVVNDKRVKRPYECEVVGFWFSKDENCNKAHLVRWANGVFDCSFSVPFTEFGKTVFLSEAEAEKAREEMVSRNE